MTLIDIEHYSKNMMATFPNSYVFTKRMAEHLLVENNTKNLPLYIIRPSIIGAALEEPFPGWTDSIGLAGGLYLLAGLGLLRELPGDPLNIGDIVPVDLVTNQIIASIPQASAQARQGKGVLYVNHCATSNVNPVNWKEVMEHLEAYWKRSPYESRIATPSVRMIKNQSMYEATFSLTRKLPVSVAFNLARLVGTASLRTKMTQLREAVLKCEEVGVLFRPFTQNEWVFANGRAYKAFRRLSDAEKQRFNFDVTRVRWRSYVMNHAYGIKKFILKEEAELPSLGYNDVVTVSPSQK